jgi:alpha-beta hydrolase superfamily lysophospholipase
MGAVVALTCLPIPELEVRAVVADSPFTSLPELVKQLAMARHVPSWLAKQAVKKVRKRVLKKAGFDINEVKPIEAVEACEKPVFFIHGREDTFVRASNSRELYGKSRCPTKKLKIVPGKHNQDRPMSVVMAATEFLCESMGLTVRFARPEVETVVAGGAAGQHFADLNEALVMS